MKSTKRTPAKKRPVKKQHPGARAHNSKQHAQALLQRVEVAKLYHQLVKADFKGSIPVEIAKRLGIARPTVWKHLKELSIEWKEERVDEFDAARRVIEQNRARITAEAWAEWERSKQDKQSIQRMALTRQPKPKKVSGQQPIDATAPPVEVLMQRVTENTEGRLGDPRFLDVIRAVDADNAKMFGLNAATKAELTGPEGGPIPVTPDLGPDWKADLARRIADIVKRREEAAGSRESQPG